MPTVLTDDQTRDLFTRLSQANHRFAAAYPGDRADRQPVHTVYGGAHLFTADTAARLGAVALRTLEGYAPDFAAFGRALGFPGIETVPHALEDLDAIRERLRRDPEAVGREHRAAWLAHTVHQRVVAKLESEPVEDYRIDFEDGYGNRRGDEEDGHATAAAIETARGLKQRTLPPFIGIRIKPLTEELRARAVRTLDLYVSTLLQHSGGVLPHGFVVTLAKVTVPEQVATLVELLARLEQSHRLEPGALVIELMVETPQSILGADGAPALPGLVAAAAGRCRGCHFGAYDYSAGLNITAAHQGLRHPACDFARSVMQVSLAGTGVTLSDSSTMLMPVPPHRAEAGRSLTDAWREENRRAVHGAWRAHYDDVRSSLRHGFYQGWDLHPGQLITRYAAVYAFFLESRSEAAGRLRLFVERAAQATLLGTVFDDAATGQGLLNFFLRGINCGALTEEEALATGLTLDELRGRSFAKILAARRDGKR